MYTSHHRKTQLYAITTQSGIRFYVEAETRAQAQQRASHPAIARGITRMILDALAEIRDVETHRGPEHAITGKLIFRESDYFPG